MKTLASYLRLIVTLIITVGVMEYIYEKPTGEWAMFTEPYFWLIVGCIFMFALAFELCIEALETLLRETLDPEAKASYIAKRKAAQERPFVKINALYAKLLGGKEIEEEHEIILDHNYDGIMELDNDLPPWWVYTFYASIIFAIVYMVRFEVLHDYTQIDEYEVAVVTAEAEIKEWKKTAKNLVDVNTVEYLTDASDLKAGSAIYNANCVACHKPNGGGGIGLNLTDKYWLLGGGIKNVFNTVSEGGRAGKGMISWKSDLKPLEMAQVSSYVLSLGDTIAPDGKEAEGEIWEETAQAN